MDHHTPTLVGSNPSNTSANTMQGHDQPTGHMMTMSDPDNPQNWPLHRKIYASAVAFFFAFAVAFGVTAYTSAITGVIAKFHVSMTVAILPMSLYLLGIAFAPVTTPHLSEAFGRSRVYLTSLPLFMLFVLGSGLANNFATLAICRFLAGFFGGPCLVLIEGTFADVWSADATNTYYSVLTLASFVGTGLGPVICGFVFAAEDWRWTQWVTLMVSLAAYLLGVGIPETYPRAIMYRRAKRLGTTLVLEPAQSGVVLSDMAYVTIVQPLKQLVSEPIVAGITLYLSFNFAVLFQFFITVPIVLSTVYNFEIQHVGLAFISPTIGAFVAAATSIIIDRVAYPMLSKKHPNTMVPIEYRLYPAMIGGFAIFASLFTIGWTASPKFPWRDPVVGTAIFVWGNMSVLISAVSYLFDAYPPRGTLSALTIAASMRLVFAAWLPLVIVQMFTNLTGAWALSTFGFIQILFLPMPWLLWYFGAGLRSRSKYNQGMMPMGKTMDDPEMRMMAQENAGT